MKTHVRISYIYLFPTGFPLWGNVGGWSLAQLPIQAYKAKQPFTLFHTYWQFRDMTIAYTLNAYILDEKMMRGEHANSNQKTPTAHPNLNPEPSCCEGTVNYRTILPPPILF